MPKLLLTVVLLALVPLAGNAFDLTPTPGFRQLEGFKIPIVRFADGEKLVTYQPPARWRITGGGQLLDLYPEDRTDVQLELRVNAIKPVDAGSAENLDAWCRPFLPKDADKIAFEGEKLSPFTLRALPSREYTYSYSTQGRRFTTAVAVVDLTPSERLTVITTARIGDFKTAREEVLRSLFTMSWGK